MTLRGRSPEHAWKLLAREPGDPRAARRRWRGGPRREGEEPHADDARPWEVGQPRSTDEAAEQSRGTGGGGGGGKAADQGEHGTANTPRTQSRISARPMRWTVCGKQHEGTGSRFTALLHHVTLDRLREAFLALSKKAAPGSTA